MTKYCTNCGKEISDEAVICVHCGCSVDSASTTTKKDSNSKGWWCLGFFVSMFFTPIIGFILWLVLKDESPMKAKQVAYGTLWSLLPVVLIIVIPIIFYFSIVAVAVGSSGMAIAPILGTIGLLA